MLFYRASLPLSRQTLNFAAGIIRRHRISIGSLWRKLNPGQQALLVLVYLRKGETFASLAAGFGVGTATAWRYVERGCPRRSRSGSAHGEGTASAGNRPDRAQHPPPGGTGGGTPRALLGEVSAYARPPWFESSCAHQVSGT